MLGLKKTLASEKEYQVLHIWDILDVKIKARGELAPFNLSGQKQVGLLQDM